MCVCLIHVLLEGSIYTSEAISLLYVEIEPRTHMDRFCASMTLG